MELARRVVAPGSVDEAVRGRCSFEASSASIVRSSKVANDSRTRPSTQSSSQPEMGATSNVAKPGVVGLTPRTYSIMNAVGKPPQKWLCAVSKSLPGYVPSALCRRRRRSAPEEEKVSSKPTSLVSESGYCEARMSVTPA